MKTTVKNRLLSLLLAAVMLFGVIPASVSALPLSTLTDSRVVDPANLDAWQYMFGQSMHSTKYAGAIWTNKSVFKDSSSFRDAANNPLFTMKDAQNNFLVALSAITSNKTIEGYSNIPTSTMLVLDVSGSMSADKVSAMVDAANDAMVELYNTNQNNRVGVVLYSGNSSQGSSGTGTATVLLAPDRYTHASNEFLVMTTQTQDNGPGGGPGGPGGGGNQTATRRVAVNSGVTYVNANGQTVTHATTSKQVVGGTYIQNGIYQAMEELIADDQPITVEDGFQAGTTYMPIIVLMSDGSPTAATSNYASVGTSNMGDGTDTSNAIGFVTQLTAAYAKARIEAHYGRSALFYTLGVGMNTLNEDGDNTVGEDNDDDIAMSVLDPKNESTDSINSYWDAFAQLTLNGSLSVGNNRVVRPNAYLSETVGVDVDADTYPDAATQALIREKQYYADRFFEAETASDMATAFRSIVNEIIIQSLYYPTLVEGSMHETSGYVSFIDKIGQYMEVKALHGILLGDILFSGSYMAEQFTSAGALGSVAQPTDLGNEFIWSVQERLGITSVTAARELVGLAFANGQLSYTDDETYSNYIGWYSDAQNNYLGFAHEGLTTAPEGAVYFNKSYGFLGEIVDGMKESDMMYISVRLMEDLSTGEQVVLFSVPAALLPVVTYNISVNADSVEEATEIKMTVDSAEPIRLIYEVGLEEGINELTVSDLVEDGYAYKNADGSYDFYTNAWDDTPAPHTHPSQAENTVAYYEPSRENERYYYIENTTVYVKNGDTYTPYTGSTLPEGEYYRAYPVYEITDPATGAAEYTMEYEVINPYAIAEAIKNDDNTWYIPKGAVRFSTDETSSPKGSIVNGEATDNNTETLDYYHTMQVVYDPNATELHYYAESTLGNNGRITVKPATGLTIEKQTDSTLTGTDYTYTFTVTRTDVADDNGTYRAVYTQANGMQAYGQVTFADSVATLGLKSGESITILDLKPGATYTVTEATEGTEYRVASVNGVEGEIQAEMTVVDNTILTATFLNTLNTTGNLIISKTVSTTLGGSYVPVDKTFTFSVELGVGTSALKDGDTFRTSKSGVTARYDAASGTLVFVSASGTGNLTLVGTEAITIFELPEGATVSVTEIQLPAGFESTDIEQGGTVVDGQNLVLGFENVYTPDEADVNVSISGSKEVDGRDWLQTDSFTFVLERLDNGTTWTEVARQTITGASTEKTFDFTSAIRAEAFDDVGTYTYRVSEVIGTIGGMTYDASHGYFHILVTDATSDGVLEIGSVTADRPATVTKAANGNWDVTVAFTNSYNVTGSADITVNIDKIMQDLVGSGYGLAGFTFGLYPQGSDEALIVSAPTDASGKTSFTLTLTAAQVGQTYTYVLKEIAGTVPGMEYSTEEKTVTVTVVDNLDGTISAVIAESGSNTYSVAFTNTYDPDDATVNISGNKVLTGRDLIAGEFTFELYEADENYGVVSGKQPAAVVNAADGTFAFPTLTFTQVGSYYYVVTERSGNTDATGIIYDETDYHVRVDVTVGDAGALVASVTVVNSTDGKITFNNTYTTQGTNVTLGGTKILNGRPLLDREFAFELRDGDGDLLYTAHNRDGGTFVFTALHYETAGDYEYTITELPGDHGGMTYSTVSYTVTVSVTDNGIGDLVATVKVGDTVITATDGVYRNGITFVNTYEADTSLPISIPASKTLEGRDLNADEFSFRISGSGIDRTVTNGADGSIDFGDFTYDAVGTYTYTIEEIVGTKGGVTYSKQKFTVTVTVVDNLDGQLVATYTIEDAEGNSLQSIEFVNTYVPDSVSESFGGLKVLDGREMIAGEFSFSLYYSDATGAQGGLIQTVGNAANGTFAFDAITFDAVGTYYYRISELAGTKGGVDYDPTDYLVIVTVTDDLNGNLEADVKYALIPSGTRVAEVIFNNDYTITGSVDITIDVNKTLNDLSGVGLLPEGFEFGLYLGDTLAQKATTNALGKASFTLTMLPSDVGSTYVYTVKEIPGTMPAMIWSTAEYEITVVVSDNGDGTLKATVTKIVATNEAGTETTTTPADGATTVSTSFVNTYDPEDVSVVIDGNKLVSGEYTLGAGDFTFDLYEVSTVRANAPIQSVTNAADGTFTFAALTFDRVGTYTYSVSERHGSIAGMVYDTKYYEVRVEVAVNAEGKLVAAVYVDDTLNGAITFNNRYVTNGTTVTLGGFKTLSGRAIKAHEFLFELVDLQSGQVIQTVQNHFDATGTVSYFDFSELVFDASGTYAYEIREQIGTLGGVTYDKSVYTVTVEVTIDPTTANLVPAVTIVKTKDATGAAVNVPITDLEDIVFANTYSTTDVDVSLNMTHKKQLDGRALTANDKFFFTLLDKNGDVVETVANDANGSFKFTKVLTFTTPGTYEYTLVEVLPAAGTDTAGITYDTTVHPVVITVTDNGSGALVAVVTVDGVVNGTATFVNTYRTEGTDTVISGTKSLIGRDLDAGEFVFHLHASDATGTQGGFIAEVTNAADGSFTFDRITYDAVGTYYYLVEEVEGSVGGVDYDETLYLVKVTVTDNGHGELEATKTITNLTNKETVTAIAFENRYTASGEVPIRIQINKKIEDLVGSGYSPAGFVFELRDENGSLVRASAPTDTNGNTTITLNFTPEHAGNTYTYTLTEQIPAVPVSGMTYSTEEYEIVIRVTDNLDGTITAVILETNTTTVSKTFTNVYDPSDAEIAISGIKTLSGRDMLAGEFTFQLYLLDSAQHKVRLLDEAVNAANGSFAFEAITYEAVGTYYYLVVEAEGNKGGVVYDATEYLVTVTVTAAADGNLVADTVITNLTAGDSVNAITFRNTYSPSGEVEIDISIDKTVDDKVGSNHSPAGFTFGLYQGEDLLLVASDPTDASGKTSLKLILTEENVGNTYTYKLKEIVPQDALGGMTYSSAYYLVTVAVTDNLDGTIRAEILSIVKVENGASTTVTPAIGTTEMNAEFTNTYDPADVSVTVEGDKTLGGREMNEGEFTFELYAADHHFYVAPGTAPIQTTNNKDGSFAFEPIVYDKVGTYYYVVEELHGDKGGVVYDTKQYDVMVVVTTDGSGVLVATTYVNGDKDGEILFDNEYHADATLVTLGGTKKLEGRPLQGHEFAFELYDANGTLIGTTKNHLDGSFAFSEIVYTEQGIYTYTVKEKQENRGGVTYDATVYTVTVTVNDDGNGSLYATTEIEVDGKTVDGILFTNTYKADPAVGTKIGAAKSLIGRPMKNGEFTFHLYKADEQFKKTADQPVAFTNGENGAFTVTFPDYDTAGIYRYILEEVASTEANGITYDPTVYLITVTVVDNLEGELIATVTMTDGSGKAVSEIAFENVYTVKNTTAVIGGHKNLVGRPLTAHEFVFRLIETDETFMAVGDVVSIARNDAQGNFTFETLTYTEAGTYYYLVTEDASAALSGVTYDGTVYRVVVEVTDDGKGNLDKKVTVTDAEGEVEKIEFKNTYEAAHTTVTLGGHKTLNGRDLEENQFFFTLYQANEAFERIEKLETVSNLASGTFGFETIHYTEDGTYYYLVVEDATNPIDRVTYDTTVYLVTVTVTDDGLGALNADVRIVKQGTETEIETIAFVNTYVPKPDDIDVTITVNKIVENKGTAIATPIGFEFVLEKEDGKRFTAVSDAKGVAKFEFTYTEADIGKTYTYKITETDEGRENMTYSDAVYMITVTISLSEDNTLVATLTKNAETVDEVVVEFVNTYTGDIPDSPQTGDSSLIVWAVVFTAGLAVAILAGTKKRRSNRR